MDDYSVDDPSAFTALTEVHKNSILQCSFSPDSDQILTGSKDSRVVLWNLPPSDLELHDDTINAEHMLICHRLEAHNSPVLSIAVHERLILSASQDGQAKLWKLIPDQRFTGFKRPVPEASTYRCSRGSIRSVDFSPDAKLFVTTSDDSQKHSVKVWSSECRNKMIVPLSHGHTNWIKCVRWSKTNGSLMASCGDDGRICIWDMRENPKFTRQSPCELITTKKRMQYNCLEWHPVFDHNIATGAQDSTCAIWDLRQRRPVQMYNDHKGPINSVAFNAGGSLLLTGSSDKTSKLFDVCEGINMFTLISHSEPITSVCFNNTGDLFATASHDKTVTVWKRNFDVVNIGHMD